MPGNRPGDVGYFAEKRDQICRALEAIGRDPVDFAFAAQVNCGVTGSERRQALEVARSMVRAGATHVVLGIPGAAGPDALADMAHEVAEPLREVHGADAGAPTGA